MLKLEFLQKWKWLLSFLTRDRHQQVRAYIKKEKPNINHQFHIWHVGKSIKKKLVAETKKSRCQDLDFSIKSVKSIINHFWLCCASCKGVEIREKWLNLLNHVSNIHSWDNATTFKKCAHKKLTKRETLEKFWLPKRSPAYQALEGVVTNKSLLSDLKFFTCFNHTGNLELYHSLYNGNFLKIAVSNNGF